MTQEARELVRRLLEPTGDEIADFHTARDAATTITTLLDKLAAAERENARLTDPAYLATAIEKVGMVDVEWKARAEKLAAALEPFAALADDYLADTVNFDDDTIMAGRITRRGEERTPPRVTFADFRRARSALADNGVANG